MHHTCDFDALQQQHWLAGLNILPNHSTKVKLLVGADFLAAYNRVETRFPKPGSGGPAALLIPFSWSFFDPTNSISEDAPESLTEHVPQSTSLKNKAKLWKISSNDSGQLKHYWKLKLEIITVVKPIQPPLKHWRLMQKMHTRLKEAVKENEVPARMGAEEVKEEGVQPWTAKRTRKMCVLLRTSLMQHMLCPTEKEIEIVWKENLCTICFKNNHTSEIALLQAEKSNRVLSQVQ